MNSPNKYRRTSDFDVCQASSWFIKKMYCTKPPVKCLLKHPHRSRRPPEGHQILFWLKLEIRNHWRVSEGEYVYNLTFLITWKLTNMLLNASECPMGSWTIKPEINKLLEIKENENTNLSNLYDTSIAAPAGKFIALQSYTKNISNKKNKSKPSPKLARSE